MYNKKYLLQMKIYKPQPCNYTKTNMRYLSYHEKSFKKIIRRGKKPSQRGIHTSFFTENKQKSLTDFDCNLISFQMRIVDSFLKESSYIKM